MQRSKVNEGIIAQASTLGHYVKERLQRSHVTVQVHLSREQVTLREGRLAAGKPDPLGKVFQVDASAWEIPNQTFRTRWRECEPLGATCVLAYNILFLLLLLLLTPGGTLLRATNEERKNQVGEPQRKK